MGGICCNAERGALEAAGRSNSPGNYPIAEDCSALRVAQSGVFGPRHQMARAIFVLEDDTMISSSPRLCFTLLPPIIFFVNSLILLCFLFCFPRDLSVFGPHVCTHRFLRDSGVPFDCQIWRCCYFELLQLIYQAL